MTDSAFVLLIVACLAVVVVVVLFRWLVKCNRDPEGPERIVAVLLALIVIESAMYQDQTSIPTSLFHLQAGSLSFRIYDVLIPLAVLARIAARPTVRARPVQLAFWSAFLVWIVTETIEGILGGNAKDFVSYEAKIVIYLGTLMLVAAVPTRRWLESRALHRVIGLSAILAACLITSNEAHVSINLNLPVLPLQTLGQLGADAASVFAILGTITLAVGLCSDERRMMPILASLPMLGAPLVAGQRAAMVELAVGLALLAVALFISREHVRVTAAEFGLAVGIALGLVVMLVLISALTTSSHFSLPLANQIQEAFNSRGKQESADDRLNQWAQAFGLIHQRPWFGWGLGKTYSYYSPGLYSFVLTDLTHNITLDLLVRTGVVGLLLFTLAAVQCVRDLFASWRRAADPRMMALAAGVGVSFVALLVKGQFESIFEKYRLALMLGGMIGVSISFANERLAERPTARVTPVPPPSVPAPVGELVAR